MGLQVSIRSKAQAEVWLTFLGFALLALFMAFKPGPSLSDGAARASSQNPTSSAASAR